MFDINQLSDFQPLRNILPDVTLRDYQVMAALSMATNSYRMLIFHTGMGKTLATIAGIVMRFNNKVTKRVLWICPLSVVKQTVTAFQSHTNLRHIVVQGTESSVSRFYAQEFGIYQVIIVNMEAFDNPDVIEIFRRMDGLFDTVVLDEAHMVANPYFSNRNSFIYMLAYRIQNRYLLTATPVISDMQQYASLIALTLNSFNEVFSIRQKVHQGDYLPEKSKLFMSYKSRDEEYDTYVHWVKCDPYIGRVSGVSLFGYTRGEEVPEVNTMLLEVIRKQGLHGFLVHCHYTKHHKFLKHLLETELGIQVEILSSKTKSRQALIQHQMQEGKLDCVVTSLTTGINLPANYIVMYDWTVFAVQAAGRGLRKERSEGYSVHFIITTVPKEITLCENSVIKNGLLTLKALGENPLKLTL